MGCTGELLWGWKTGSSEESAVLVDHNHPRGFRGLRGFWSALAGTRQQESSSSSRQRRLLGLGAIRAVQASELGRLLWSWRWGLPGPYPPPVSLLHHLQRAEEPSLRIKVTHQPVPSDSI